ncbi:hypothetical protein H2203_003664 [Taxawa tesnikishii (nom. ined.)]|nr:hypothetical protein H2203_003664 [Dothideales sp. JES 119]
MAFSGYNFPSLEAIKPYLEPTAGGISTQWAQSTARRLNCHVTVGYPEITTASPPKHYNSLVTVSPTGEIVATYRKSFLYYTDETWASEGDAGFYHGPLGALGPACMGICMDINPHRFTAPWAAYEFATHCVDKTTPLVVLSMAWLTRLLPQELMLTTHEPDLETLGYWIERFFPLVNSKSADGVIVVMANRCGTEPGSVAGVTRGVGESGEEVVCYAGSSCVLKLQDGNVQVYNILGKAEDNLLVVDTKDVSGDLPPITSGFFANPEKHPRFALQQKPAA